MLWGNFMQYFLNLISDFFYVSKSTFYLIFKPLLWEIAVIYKGGEVVSPDFKICHKNTIIKTACYWCKANITEERFQ